MGAAALLPPDPEGRPEWRTVSSLTVESATAMGLVETARLDGLMAPVKRLHGREREQVMALRCGALSTSPARVAGVASARASARLPAAGSYHAVLPARHAAIPFPALRAPGDEPLARRTDACTPGRMKAAVAGTGRVA
jgi:hypothetical protein